MARSGSTRSTAASPTTPHAMTRRRRPVMSRTGPPQPARPDPGDDGMRAAIYARVSTERQERQQTIGSQVSALRDWAAAAGHALPEAHVFRDDGFSGSRLDRPALDALRDAVRDAAVDVVAVFSPDRPAREFSHPGL